MKIDIVIPTYKRYKKLIRCLESIPHQDNLKVWIYCDNKDKDTYNKIKHFHSNAYLLEEQYRAFGIWNFHLKWRFFSDIFCYLCDDTRVYAETFTHIHRHFIEKFPDTDGVVTFKQSNLSSGSDSAMGCIGKKFIDRYPYRQAFCPNYKSFFADTEIGDYAKKLGKFHYGEDCLIEHYHPSIYPQEMDDTHKTIRDKEKDIDIKINQKRKNKGLLWGENFELISRRWL